MAEMSCPGLALSPMAMRVPLMSIAEIYLLAEKMMLDLLPSKSWRALATGMRREWGA